MLEIFHAASPSITRLVEKTRQRARQFLVADRGTAADRLQSRPDLLARLLNVAFWASLESEEGRLVRIALAIADQDDSARLRFNSPISLDVKAIVRLAPAIESSLAAIDLSDRDELQVWGLLETPPDLRPVIRVNAPGSITVAEAGEVFWVVKSGRERLVPGEISWPMRIAGAIGRGVDYTKAHRILTVVAAMSQHSHGGAIVVVPPASNDWKRLVSSGLFATPASGNNLSLLLRDAEANTREVARLQEAHIEVPPVLLNERDRLLARSRRGLGFFGNLTAVDGAVIIDRDLALLGLGAKLIAGKEGEISGLILEDPLDGTQTEVELTAVGGTRHQSAARFVAAAHDCAVFVASQDGRVSLFRWDDRKKTVVQLTQLEALLGGY